MLREYRSQEKTLHRQLEDDPSVVPPRLDQKALEREDDPSVVPPRLAQKGLEREDDPSVVPPHLAQKGLTIMVKASGVRHGDITIMS